MAAAFISQVEHQFFENLVNDFLNGTYTYTEEPFDCIFLEEKLPFPDHVDIDLVADLGYN
jgi:hypothetical protein